MDNVRDLVDVFGRMGTHVCCFLLVNGDNELVEVQETTSKPALADPEIGDSRGQRRQVPLDIHVFSLTQDQELVHVQTDTPVDTVPFCPLHTIFVGLDLFVTDPPHGIPR